MDPRGRQAYAEFVESRAAEVQKNITTLEQKASKKDDLEARERIASMKEKLAALIERGRKTGDIRDDAWPDFKSETDLLMESLDWLNGFVQRRLGAA